MKKNLMLLLVSALLVYSLTACGCAARDTGTTQNNPTAETTQPEANNGDTNNGAANSGSSDTGVGNGTDGANIGDGNTIGSGESMLENAGDAIQDGVNDAADAITGNDSANGDGVAIDDMLRNGRVRDN